MGIERTKTEDPVGKAPLGWNQGTAAAAKEQFVEIERKVKRDVEVDAGPTIARGANLVCLRIYERKPEEALEQIEKAFLLDD